MFFGESLCDNMPALAPMVCASLATRSMESRSTWVFAVTMRFMVSDCDSKCSQQSEINIESDEWNFHDSKHPEKKKLKLPSFSSSSASVCPNFSVAFHHLPHYSALDIVGYIVISYCTLLMLTLHDIISIWFRHSIPIHHSLVHHFCWFTSPFIKAPIKPICRATRMSSAAPSSAAFKASACPIPWLAPVISANVLMLLDGLKTDC